MVVRIRDLMAAEEQLDEHLAELRALEQPDAWSARESVDRDGRRTLHVAQSDIERQDAARDRVRRAEDYLRSLQQAFGAGIDLGAPREYVPRSV